METRLSAAAAVTATAPGTVPSRAGWLQLAAVLFKLRIAFSIVLSALAGAVLAAGGWPAAADSATLALGVLLAAAGAGACNHYLERDIDARMRRTRHRPFVTGAVRRRPGWLLAFAAMIAAGSLLAGLRTGVATGLLVLAGALTYTVIYTLWLKRRTCWNIVIGGAAGSFAVLAGGAAAGDVTSPAVLLLAAVLFLWTPSHFWALAIALHEDYRRAGVPMLPVTHGRGTAARWAAANTVLLVAASVALAAQLGAALPWLAVLGGGGALLWTATGLLRDPRSQPRAMAAFHASLLQLGLLLAALLIHAGAQ